MKHRVDVAIIGSGFSGSILARILVGQGMRVALIDAATHPRFAIGESSTPIADMILRGLGRRYGLDDLVQLSTWGSWQQHHQDLAGGCKRGFSYYAHEQGERFHETRRGDRSLVVAATASDEIADTHWYRSDVDHYFFERAIEAGAIDLSSHAAIAHEVSEAGRSLTTCESADRRVVVESDWLIDASGQSGVLAKLSGADDLSDQLQTATHCQFAHFDGVGSWTSALQSHGFDLSRDPFDADDAAQHHLLQSGWMWMLRFNNGITSVGYTTPIERQLNWSGFPSIDALLGGARNVAPGGSWIRSGRLQRMFDPVVDSRRIMLPTAAITLDPLHSTGIAHALAGVERVVPIVTESDSATRQTMLGDYRQAVLQETRLLDRLVSTAYATIDDFPRFTVACMLYFAGAIRCEERYEQGETPSQLWNADDREFGAMVEDACGLLLNRQHDEFHDEIRGRLEPWNGPGLMNPLVENRYARTAVKTGS